MSRCRWYSLVRPPHGVCCTCSASVQACKPSSLSPALHARWRRLAKLVYTTHTTSTHIDRDVKRAAYRGVVSRWTVGHDCLLHGPGTICMRARMRIRTIIRACSFDIDDRSTSCRPHGRPLRSGSRYLYINNLLNREGRLQRCQRCDQLRAHFPARQGRSSGASTARARQTAASSVAA